MKAVKRFDPDMGVRLVSFAVHWIRAEIHEFVIRNWRLVRVATTKAQRKLFFNLRRMKKNLAWLSDDEARAVASELGVEPGEVREMEQRLSSRDLSFDPAPDTDDDEGIVSPSLYLPSAEADPATAIEKEQWDGAVAESLSAAISTLDDRSRAVVRARWLAEEKRTLQDLADDYGVSAERIRQIESTALKKLRAAMTSS
jgi:RNA polymerase sigma-32 factor